jgi:hypothetical protein
MAQALLLVICEEDKGAFDAIIPKR